MIIHQVALQWSPTSTSKLDSTIENGYEVYRRSLQYGYTLKLKVSFKMGLFSDTKHTHPDILIFE